MHSSNHYVTLLSCLNGGARLGLSLDGGPILPSIPTPILAAVDGVESELFLGRTRSPVLQWLLTQLRLDLARARVHVLGQARCLSLAHCRNRSLYRDRYRLRLRLTSGRLTQARIRMADGTVARLLTGRRVHLARCESEN